MEAATVELDDLDGDHGREDRSEKCLVPGIGSDEFVVAESGEDGDGRIGGHQHVARPTGVDQREPGRPHETSTNGDPEGPAGRGVLAQGATAAPPCEQPDCEPRQPQDDSPARGTKQALRDEGLNGVGVDPLTRELLEDVVVVPAVRRMVEHQGGDHEEGPQRQARGNAHASSEYDQVRQERQRRDERRLFREEREEEQDPDQTTSPPRLASTGHGDRREQ